MKNFRIPVSVIIPLYNNRRFIENAINSVLMQKDVLLECIVIDDGSSDGSGDLIKERFGSRITLLHQENKGVSAARNLGAQKAEGQYLALLDADDYWTPTKLLHQVTFIENHPTYAAVYCQGLRVDEEGNPIYRIPFGSGIRDEDFQFTNTMVKPKSPALGSTLLIKSEVFKILQGFDTNLTHGEDTDFRLRLAQAGFNQHMISRPLAFIRYDRASASHSLDEGLWMRSYRSHLMLYEKLLRDSPSGKGKNIIECKILNFQIRQLLYFLQTGKHDEANQLREQIKKNTMLLNMDSKDFYSEIEFFTPLIYLEDGWQALSQFIEMTLAERDAMIPDSKNILQDELARIKASVWCAGQGKFSERIFSLWLMLNSLLRAPGLFINIKFWTQFLRLIFGDLIIRVNIKWHEILMKF